MWSVGIRRYNIQLPWRFILKITAMSAFSSLAAYIATFRLTPLPGLIAGCAIATGTFITLGYSFKILEPEDRDRFRVISNACPQPVATPLNYLLDRFTRRLASDSTTV
jgi:hypothetical protein